MYTSLMPNPKNQFFGPLSLPLVGGKIFTFAAGTSTPKATFTDKDGVTAQPNPIILNSRGEPPSTIYWAGSYKVAVYDLLNNLIYTVDNFQTPVSVDGLASSTGAGLIGFDQNATYPAASMGLALVNASTFIQEGVGATTRTPQNKARDIFSVKDFGAAGNGGDDDTAEIAAAIANTPQRGRLDFSRASVSYKIASTLDFTGKAGAYLDFGNQQINAGGFVGAPKTAIFFKGVSEARIQNIFLIGSVATVSEGVYFAADAANITIHAMIEKIRVSQCTVGVLFGTPVYQFDDCSIDEIYASDCVTGIKITGENTLSMKYGRLAAYNNTTIGVHIEQGGGSIESLQVAASGSDIFFGSTAGTNHNLLARWDILSGYSEEGTVGERFINSTACTDTNPFTEEVVINGFRCTPFSNTNTADFIKWKLNGDLTLRNCTINHGQQLPVIALDHNTAYRSPTVTMDGGTIGCYPLTSPQLPMSYTLTDPRQTVEINARVTNGLSFWYNGGAAGNGVTPRGIYMRKLANFKDALLGIGNLKGAWSLRDMPSGQCRNLVLGGPNLALSATMERRDFWLDDGLVGLFRNATTSKTIATTSATYNAKTEYTFGAILRPVAAGSAEESMTTLGGATGIRIALYDAAGGVLLCLVGGVNAFAAVTNPYDAHLVIGRYVSATSVKVDAINLRTGERLAGVTTVGVPAFGALAWSNGVSMRNDTCVRGFPFVYDRALTDPETSSLLQSALALTDSWRL